MFYKVMLPLLHVMYSIFCSVLLRKMFFTNPRSQFLGMLLYYALV